MALRPQMPYRHAYARGSVVLARRAALAFHEIHEPVGEYLKAAGQMLPVWMHHEVRGFRIGRMIFSMPISHCQRPTGSP